MPFSLLADLTVVIHIFFVLFVVFGGLAVLRLPRLAWLHVPAVVWGVVLEFEGLNCPLTFLENHWRRQAGINGYSESFIAHYLEPLLYPPGLTVPTQVYLGSMALVVNLAIYLYLLMRGGKKYP